MSMSAQFADAVAFLIGSFFLYSEFMDVVRRRYGDFVANDWSTRAAVFAGSVVAFSIILPVAIYIAQAVVGLV